MIQARQFPRLRGNLTGLSDRLVDAHLKLYQGYVETLNAIQAAYPMTDWGQLAAGAPAPIASVPILGAPVAKLELRAVGPLADALAVVRREFDAKGFPPEAWPAFYLGDEDFWTTDKGVSINIPWYLANPLLWRLSNQATGTRYSFEQVLRCLRHELGHAIFFAYQLGAVQEWREAFGNSDLPYKDTYEVVQESREHVHYLTGVTAHYPQKHPEEDWAEAFGRWLDAEGDWRAEFASWPIALNKLEAVETINKLVRVAKPTNAYRGRPTPYTTLKGTVADRLGIPRLVQPFSGRGWSEHSELLRREPYYMNAVALHELYFENLKGNSPPAFPLFFDQTAIGWGSWDSFTLDFRAMMGSTGGWALTVWDTRNNCLKNVLVEQHHIGVAANCPIILAVDCWEHAYAMDYGIRKDLYVGAIFKNIDWAVVESRLMRAIGGGAALTPVIVTHEPSLAESEFEIADPDDEDEARMAGRGGLVAVMREITNVKGTTFKRPYWVKPKDVKPTDKVIDKPGKPPKPIKEPTLKMTASKVGVGAFDVPPPPPIPRLKGLPPEQAKAEEAFAKEYEKDPDRMAHLYMEQVRASKTPNLYNTDDAKLLSPHYNQPGKPEERGIYNLAVHQTANAIAKRAFLMHLDELDKLPHDDPKRSILVTSGGVAAGKGYALDNVPETASISKKVGAIWDAAGEQNATENPWVLKEASKRGLKSVFVYVDADPYKTWENPERGVVQRAVAQGRMVDAHPYSGSFPDGAHNFNNFYEDTTLKQVMNPDPDARFLILQNRGTPKLLSAFPKEALDVDRNDLYKYAARVLDERAKDLPRHVVVGGSIGRAVWGHS